jgi:hypothetical protein
MKVTSIFTKSPAFWGLTGGIALISMPFLTTNGYLQLLPYPIILMGAILTAKFAADNQSEKFNDSFKAGFIAFVIMSAIYICIGSLFINAMGVLSIAGYMWRMAVVIALGAVSSILVSFLLMPVHFRKAMSK